MNKAKLLKEIMVFDPETNVDVEMSIYKHENGGVMAIDSSFLDQCFDDDNYPVVPDPFSKNIYKPDMVMLMD